MYWTPRLPIGSPVADRKAKATGDPRTTREYAERDRAERTRNAVHSWAAKRGLPTQPAPKRTRNRRPAWARDREANGPARTLQADEIRRLGYSFTEVNRAEGATSKPDAPEPSEDENSSERSEPERAERAPKGARTVHGWQARRTIRPGW